MHRLLVGNEYSRKKSIKPGEENWKGQGGKLDEMVRLPVRELAFAQDPKRQENDAYRMLERNLILYR